MGSETAFDNSESSYIVGKFKEQLWSLWLWIFKKPLTELREVNKVKKKNKKKISEGLLQSIW